MKRYQIMIFIMIGMILNCNAHRTVLLYMDSTPDLSDMAIKALSELMEEKSNSKVDFFVQLHSYGNKAFRYKVTNEGLAFVSSVELSGDAQEDLINAAKWAYRAENIDETMLFFSNHGYGPLDPDYNETIQGWDLKLSNDMIKSNPKRGFMFNSVAKSYLTYHDMSQSLAAIKKLVLNDKKIDIIGFDTCMGGCIEIAYQLKDYGHYLIGAQVCSKKDGFDYKALMHDLKKIKSKKDFVYDAINSLESYYKLNDDNGMYAYTALDLSKVEKVVKKFEKLNTHILQNPLKGERISQAGSDVFRPCMFTMYIDFIHYLESLEHVLCAYGECEKHMKKFAQLKKAINEMVVHKCAGFKSSPFVHGCALYFPADNIHHSYLKVEFAQKTKWISLLESSLFTK